MSHHQDLSSTLSCLRQNILGSDWAHKSPMQCIETNTIATLYDGDEPGNPCFLKDKESYGYMYVKCLRTTATDHALYKYFYY